MEGHEERKGRAAGLRLGKIQLYPSAKSHQWLKKRAGEKTKKKWANTLMGVALGICTLLLAAMWLTESQHAVTGRVELLCAAVCGCGWQIGTPSTPRLGGEKRASRYSMLQHIVTHCNMPRQWKRQPNKNKKRGKKDRKAVAPCSQIAKGVAGWCQKLQCAAGDSCRLQRVGACCSVPCIVTGGIGLSDIAVCCTALNWVASGADNLVSEFDMRLNMSRWVETYCSVPRHNIICHNTPKGNTWDMRHKSFAKRIKLKTGVLDITFTSVIGTIFTGIINASVIGTSLTGFINTSSLTSEGATSEGATSEGTTSE